MQWLKKGRVFETSGRHTWWLSHAMAPSAILMSPTRIRIFIGCWDEQGISRIGYVDVEKDNPSHVVSVASEPVLDLGRDGTFDDNGVFPAHASVIGSRVYLYYTGFQLCHKIRYTNFGGLAISDDGGTTFRRMSEAPILDRADEGLHVRAGQSVLLENGIYRTVYSVGSGWISVGGKQRPTYDICYQESSDGITYGRAGQRILTCDHAVEHGLGRPQIIRVENDYLVFYTRRMTDMRYHLGCARSTDCCTWNRIDDQIGIAHSEQGWDSEMVYFPSVLQTGDRVYLFYNGNDFGRTGFGYAELGSW
jgi:hypothetical protein